eukprot:31208-Pelagococcus_subviridis.AAC.11
MRCKSYFHSLTKTARFATIRARRSPPARETTPRARLLRRGIGLRLLLLLRLRLRILDALRHRAREVRHRAPLEDLVKPEHDLERPVHPRPDHALDVVLRDLSPPLVRDERLRGSRDDDVASQTVHVHERAHAGDFDGQISLHLDLLQELLRRRDLRLELVRLLLARLHEPLRVLLELHAVLHELHAKLAIEDRPHVARHPEPIEELRPELALLGVPRADHDELRRVRDRDPLALDRVPPARGGVEDDVHERVVQKVHLVDVQKPAVRAREEAGVVRLDALRERLFDVDGAADAVLRRPERDLDHGDLHRSRGDVFLRPELF